MSSASTPWIKERGIFAKERFQETALNYITLESTMVSFNHVGR